MKNPGEGTPLNKEIPQIEDSIEEAPAIEVGSKVEIFRSFIESPKSRDIIKSLQENGLEQNPDLVKFKLEMEQAINLIADTTQSRRSKEMLDIKVALLIGFGGDPEEAYNLICDIGETSQKYTHDFEIEDCASAALELLGF